MPCLANSLQLQLRHTVYAISVLWHSDKGVSNSSPDQEVAGCNREADNNIWQDCDF